MAETISEVKKGMRSFIIRMFVIGGTLGLIASTLYIFLGHSSDKIFHSFVIFAGLAFTFPMFTVSIQLMLKMFYMSVEATEKQNEIIEKFHRVEREAGPIVDKIKEVLTVHAEPALKKIDQVIDRAVPIAKDVEEVASRAKGMAEDIEQVVHRVRHLTDAINGHFDIKSIESRLDKVAESLMIIASVFDPPKKKTAAATTIEEKPQMTAAFPVFDPLTSGRKR